LRIEYADVSLVGDREDNQDRVAIAAKDKAAFLIVIDGMGGHSDGSRAADTALRSLLDSFHQMTLPMFDPIGFLHMSLSRAHDDVARLGNGQSIDSRPRATVAVCLVQEGAAYWAHVGDSRIYHIRNGKVVTRTRDHSHVELLLREGKITEEELPNHPMRNFVECCLGGDTPLPNMSITARKKLVPGDVLLACTDGLWAGLDDAEIGALAASPQPLERALRVLAERAVARNHPHSDNTTVAALRWLGD